MCSYNKIIVCLIVSSIFCACDFIKKYQLGDAVARVEDSALYQADIDRLTAGIISSEDSAKVVEEYIRQWATDELMYKRALEYVNNKKQLDTLIEVYRHSLYVRQYEEQLVTEKMAKNIEDDTLRAFYESYPERFRLRENLFKGIFVVVSSSAPEQERLVKAMTFLGEDNLEEIEKYAYQYAIGYEFFVEQWQPLYKLLLRLPTVSGEQDVQTALVDVHLKQDQLLQFSDTTANYYFRVTDRRLQGDKMPYEYAETEIRRIILQKRERDFLKKQKETIYENALRTGKLMLQEN